MHRVRLSAGDESRRSAGLRASHEWFEATIFDLDVSVTLFEYDDEADKEAALRELSLVVRAYLRGEGRVEHRGGLMRRRRPVWIVTVNDREWELGHRVARVPYP